MKQSSSLPRAHGVCGISFRKTVLVTGVLASLVSITSYAQTNQPATPGVASAMSAAAPNSPVPGKASLPGMGAVTQAPSAYVPAGTQPSVPQATPQATPVPAPSFAPVGAASPTTPPPLASGSGVAPTSMPKAGGLDPTAQPEPTWVLEAAQHPWPLHFAELTPITALPLNIPSAADVKLMLPGRAADLADQARMEVSRFFTSVISTASQTRGSQLEALSTWIDRTNQQASTMKPDMWAKYEFYREAHLQTDVYQTKLAAQSGPQTERVVAVARDAVSKIAAIIDVMPTYETRLAWYNVLVQLKEGVTLYQTQMSGLDERLASTIAQYQEQHPPVTRPVGEPPSSEKPRTAQMAPSTPDATDLSAQDKHQPAAAAPQAQQSSDSTGGIVVVLGLILAVIAFVYKLRKRNKSVPVAAEK